MYYTYYDYASNMDIAEESVMSFIKNIKSKLKKMILRFIQWIEKQFKKIKNPKIRKIFVGATTKLRKLLGDVDDIKRENVETKPQEIEEEFNEIKEEVCEAVGVDDPEVDDIDTDSSREPGTEDENIRIEKRARTGKSTYYYQATFLNNAFSDKVYDEFMEADKAKTFSEYISHYRKVKKMLKLPDKCTVYSLMIQDDDINLTYILEDHRAKKNNINKPLYHTSEDPNLTQITPQWRAERGKLPLTGRWFDAPRAYFGIFPMNRMGGKVKPGDGRYIYKAEGIKSAFIDNDGIKFGTSVYVEQNASIPLTKVE